MSIKHHHRQGNLHSGFAVVGFFFGAILLFVLFNAHRKRKERRHYGLIYSENRVQQQIDDRKKSLKRYITRLQKQLEYRESQLQQHEELSEIVTSRVETARVDLSIEDEKWNEIMSKGREIYGDVWEKGTEDTIPLRTLMTMHKEELLQIQEENDKKNGSQKKKKIKSSKKTQRNIDVTKSIENQNIALLKKNDDLIEKQNQQLLNDKRFEGSNFQSTLNLNPDQHKTNEKQNQWISQRRSTHFQFNSYSFKPIETFHSTESIVKKKPTTVVTPMQIPKLDFSKLNSDTTIVSSTETESIEKKQMSQAIAASHRRARLQELNKLRSQFNHQ